MRRIGVTMMEEPSENSRHYAIEIFGHLSDSRVRAFYGLGITLTPEGHTIISGQMDQSALFGALLRIRDFGTPLLSVSCLDLQLDARSQ